MNMVKNAPLPPEDHEAFEMMNHIKSHFQKREKNIKDSRELRQEAATLLKAKLIVVKRDMGIEQLFEMATEIDPSEAPTEATKAPEPEATETPEQTPEPTTEVVEPTSERVEKVIEHVDEYASVLEKLERAEFFIKDLGVWDHYEKFLSAEKT
jgi:hypothetical protein